MVWIVTSEKQAKALEEIFRTQEARIVVIVGCAAIEDALKEVLTTLMSGDKSIRKDAFKRVLMGLSARNHIAYLFGKYERNIFDTISNIGKIRNWYAHRLDVNSFEYTDLQLDEWWNQLTAHEGRAKYPDVLGNDDLVDIPLVDSRKIRFIVNFRIVLYVLNEILVKHRGLADPSTDYSAPNRPGAPIRLLSHSPPGDDGR